MYCNIGEGSGNRRNWTAGRQDSKFLKILKAKAHSAHVKLQHVWRSRLCIKAEVRIFHNCIGSSLLHGLDSLTLESRHLNTIDGWYFRYLRRAIGVKASFYSRISNQRVWVLAGRPILPTQILLTNYSPWESKCGRFLEYPINLGG